MASLFRYLLPAAAACVLFLTGCDGGLAMAKECHRIGDYPRAKRLFEAEIDRDPTSFEARYGYAIVLQELLLGRKALGQDHAEDWLEVVKAYEVTSKLGEGGAFAGNWAIALFHLANKLYLQEKHESALEYLAQARRLEPKNKYVLNLAGIVEYSLGRYKEAQETFEYLLAVDPRFLSAYLNLGNVLWESGQEDAALVTWKQALTMSPGNQSIIRRIETALHSIAGP
ncbi:MAG TPA: tetratricopeptide repeat protein [Fibrobacteria bacterium]|nr:tetratricopeptide repeat protein [Fibrobacteria bacterium]